MNALVAYKIKQLRTNKGLSQEQVADHLHISQSTYARIENGETSIWANYIEPISNLFKISPEDLLRQESITISQNKGKSTNAFIINQISEKLITQYEENSRLKDDIIKDLRERLKSYDKK